MEIIWNLVGNVGTLDFHTNCHFHSMEIVWIYYGFSDTMGISIEWISPQCIQCQGLLKKYLLMSAYGSS
jgi:hypothetical protein